MQTEFGEAPGSSQGSDRILDHFPPHSFSALPSSLRRSVAFFPPPSQSQNEQRMHSLGSSSSLAPANPAVRGSVRIQGVFVRIRCWDPQGIRLWGCQHCGKGISQPQAEMIHAAPPQNDALGREIHVELCRDEPKMFQVVSNHTGISQRRSE